MEILSSRDREVAERQLGRKMRGKVLVASRCPHGVVEVIATAPLLPDGVPFPTLYWLTCPLLHREVSRLEGGGFRAGLRIRLERDRNFSRHLEEAERAYIMDRDRWAAEEGELERVRELFSGRDGIGGTVSGGIKCLHAHLAHYLAAGVNPVGAEVAAFLDACQEHDCRGDCGAFLKEA